MKNMHKEGKATTRLASSTNMHVEVMNGINAQKQAHFVPQTMLDENSLSVQVGNTGHVLSGIAQRQQVLVPRLQPNGRTRSGLAFALLFVVKARMPVAKDDVGKIAGIFAKLQHAAVINTVGTAGGDPLQCIAQHRRAKIVLPGGAVVILPSCIGRSHESANEGHRSSGWQDTALHCYAVACFC